MVKSIIVRMKASTLVKLRRLFRKDRYTSYSEFFDMVEKALTKAWREAENEN